MQWPQYNNPQSQSGNGNIQLQLPGLLNQYSSAETVPQNHPLQQLISPERAIAGAVFEHNQQQQQHHHHQQQQEQQHQQPQEQQHQEQQQQQQPPPPPQQQQQQEQQLQQPPLPEIPQDEGQAVNKRAKRRKGDKRRATTNEKKNLLLEFERLKSNPDILITQTKFVQDLKARELPFAISKTTFNDWWMTRNKILNRPEQDLTIQQPQQPIVQTGVIDPSLNRKLKTRKPVPPAVIRFGKASAITEKHLKTLVANGAKITEIEIKDEFMRNVKLIPDEYESFLYESDESLADVLLRLRLKLESSGGDSIVINSAQPSKSVLKQHTKKVQDLLSGIEELAENEVYNKLSVDACRNALIELIDMHDMLVHESNTEQTKLSGRDRVLLTEVRRILSNNC
ncbi:unnamed protein product [Ambrosiozyma monospora]|uniref:Unnamed protein product n=1 Tax=Ambrosiozyma monospora TaxID=43982 RepID=A0A9W6Z3N0_AMBMO|nr:unnamed protein product [Ambrosiozyma monospora]